MGVSSCEGSKWLWWSAGDDMDRGSEGGATGGASASSSSVSADEYAVCGIAASAGVPHVSRETSLAVVLGVRGFSGLPTGPSTSLSFDVTQSSSSLPIQLPDERTTQLSGYRTDSSVIDQTRYVSRETSLTVTPGLRPHSINLHLRPHPPAAGSAALWSRALFHVKHRPSPNAVKFGFWMKTLSLSVG